MSRLAEPQYEEIFLLVEEVAAKGLEQDAELQYEELQADLEAMADGFRVAQGLTTILLKGVEQYDSKTGTKANGYRSIVRVVGTLVRHCTEVVETVRHQQSTLGYVAPQVGQDVKTWMAVLERITRVLEVTVEVRECGLAGQLYPDTPDCRHPSVQALSEKVYNLDVTPFYGAALGFHLRGDSRRMMQPLMISMASFSDVYGGSIIGKFKRLQESGYCWDYIRDPEARAERVVANSRNMQVDFAQNFYNMSENDWVTKMKTLPKMKTSVHTKIVYTNKLEVPKEGSEEMFRVPVPSSHIKSSSLPIRLVANYRTKAMLGSCGCATRFTCTCKFAEARDLVILHVHGGGFISQTSKSHLDYLYQWAIKLDVPIVSVDYSLAPGAPYPRALEEVVYAYCWLLNNFPAVGCNGKKVLLAGDSAGGNLTASLTLKCIQLGIRKPDALVLSYAALLIQFFPSPSRMLCLLDPLLMLGILLRCLNAYQDPTYMKSLPRTLRQELTAAKSVNDIFMSPLLASNDILKQFPRTVIIASDLDPCLDENVQFSSKLFEAGVEVKMEVVPGMPHGFLSFCQMSTECQLGVDHVTRKLRELIKSITATEAGKP